MNVRICVVLTWLVVMLVGVVGATPRSHAAALDGTPTPQRVTRAGTTASTIYLPFTSGGAGSAPTTTPPTTPPTTTPPATQHNGFFASTTYLTYNAATAVDAQGGVHLAFYTSDEQHEDAPQHAPAYYTYCPPPASACVDPSKWSALVQFGSQVTEVQIVVTTDGRPRLLVRRNSTSDGYVYDYYACDRDCRTAANWSGVVVQQAAGVELNHADMPQHAFALDSQNRPRFVYSNGWGNGYPAAVYYASCDATDCTQLDSWQETAIQGPLETHTVTADAASLVFDGDKPRVVTRINLSGLPDRVDYLTCDTNCGASSSWSNQTLFHPEHKLWANWDIALDRTGRPHFALYEATELGITVGGKLFYGWCDNGCGTDADVHLVQITSGEGKNVAIAVDPIGRIHMVYDAGSRGTIAEVWCAASCADAGQWQHRTLETSDELQQAFAPPSPLTCDQQERAWLDAIPTVSFDAQSNLVVAYDIKNVATCYYQDPTNPTPIGSRVERLWWAVRWAFFAPA